MEMLPLSASDTTSTARSQWILVAFLVPFALLAIVHWNWGPQTGNGDYAQYLGHARAIAEGRPYTDIGYIYHPRAPMVGPRAYPPGLPLTLAPIVALDGVDSPLIRVLMLLTVVALAYLAYRRLAIDIAPWQAAIAAGFSAFAVEASLGTIVPLSDAGLCALMWGTILAADTAGAWRPQRIIVVTVLGFAAIAYRVAGVALVPALAVYALLTYQQHRGRAFIPVVIWIAAAVAAVAAGVATTPLVGNLIPVLSELLERGKHLLLVYPRAALDAQLYPLPGNAPNDIYHIVASAISLAGCVALLWRSRRTMLTATVVMYLGVLLASPAMADRYVWPLFPVLAAGLVLGVSAICRALTSRLPWLPRSQLLTAGLMALILAGALVRESSSPEPIAAERTPDARAVYRWLATVNAQAPVRAAYANPRVLTLESRVPAMAHVFAVPSKHLQALQDLRITHLVLPIETPRECRARLAHELPGLYPEHFSLEYENLQYRVYRLVNLDTPIQPIDGYLPVWGGARCNPTLPDVR